MLVVRVSPRLKFVLLWEVACASDVGMGAFWFRTGFKVLN
jgi:hypothetical protein